MRRYRILVLAVSVTAALALAACSGATTTPGTGTTGGASSSGATVSMVGLAFNPSTVDVPVGGTVTFVNDDTVQHNVAGESWSSGPLDPGKSFTQAFSTAGAIAVRCTIHPSMTMTVNVK
jgi:plastocyanin